VQTAASRYILQWIGGFAILSVNHGGEGNATIGELFQLITFLIAYGQEELAPETGACLHALSMPLSFPIPTKARLAMQMPR
jgi:hypothetical protein